MPYNITPRDDAANRTFVYEDYAPPPTPALMPTPEQHVVSDATLGQLMLGANILITTIIVIAMMKDGTTALAAIIVGSLYFTVTTIGFAVVTTGAMTAVVNAYQVQRTERQRVAAYRELGTLSLHWRLEVERSRQMEMQPAQALPPLHRPDVQGALRVSPLNTFVEPYADSERAALEGVRWAEQLYDRTALGAPDPRKVQLSGESLGRLRVRMIGSKRGGGSRDAGVWLLRNGVIRKVAGGYALRVDQYPYRHYLSTLL